MARRVGLLLALALVACDASSSAIDAGVADGSTDPFAVAPAALPSLLPCPPGWREVADESGVSSCDPWPATGRRSDCAADEGHFPGDPDCTRVGTECPADGWPADLPAGASLVYVNDDAPAGGDGLSRATAFRNVTDAVSASHDGDVIAVATGHYDGFFVSAYVSIIGACASGTVLTSSVHADDDAVIWLVHSGNVVRNLSIVAPERTAVVIDAAADATFEDVVIAGPRLSAFYVRGALTLHDVVVRDVRPGDDGRIGRGLDVHPGGSVTLQRGVIERTHDAAILGDGVGCMLDVSDLSIADVALDPTGTVGDGIDTYDGCGATIARTVIEGVSRGALYCDGAGSRTAATDLVAQSSAASGVTSIASVVAASGGAVTLTRTRIDHAVVAAVLAQGPGSSVGAADLVIRDVASGTDGTRGFAIGCDMGAALDVTRALFQRAHSVGLIASDEGTTAHATDVTILDTLSRELDGSGGFGIGAQLSAHVTLARARIERPQSAGLFVELGAAIDGTDVLIHDVRVDRAGTFAAVGAYADQRGVLTLTRASVDGARAAGIASDEQSSVVLDHVSVANILSPECVATTCPNNGAASGLVVDQGATLTATSFVVEAPATCGVVVGAAAADGTPPGMDLSDGVIENTQIGACVQFDGFDPERLHHDVRFQDVGVPLQATSYALPTVSGGL